MLLGNGLEETTDYNTRLQPCLLRAGTAPLLQLSLRYGASDQGCDNVTGNNGNIVAQAIMATGNPGLNVTQTYGYDALNRDRGQSANSSAGAAIAAAVPFLAAQGSGAQSFWAVGAPVFRGRRPAYSTSAKPRLEWRKKRPPRTNEPKPKAARMAQSLAAGRAPPRISAR